MTHFNGKLDTLLREHTEMAVQILGRKLNFQYNPEWQYTSPHSHYCFEAFVIEDRVIYLKETGKPEAKDLKKTDLFLRRIISSFPSQTNLCLIHDITQLKFDQNTSEKKLTKLIKEFNPFFQQAYLLLSASDLNFPNRWLTSEEKVQTTFSLEEAIVDCIKGQKLLKIFDPIEVSPMQDLKKASHQDLIRIIKRLEKENQQLKQVHEHRLIEVLQTLESFTEEASLKADNKISPKNNAPADINKVLSFLRRNVSSESQVNEKIVPYSDFLSRSLISDEGSALSRLKERDEQFSMISENYQDLICLLHLDGNICYASPSVHSTLGFNTNEIIGAAYLDLIHPDDLAELEKKQSSFFSEQLTTRELRMKKKDGHYIWMEINTKIIRGSAEQNNRIMVSSRDVTEIKQIIERLTESQEQLKSTLSSIDDDVYVFDKNHRLISSNVKLHKLKFLTTSHDRCLGQHFNDIFPEALSTKLKTALSHIAETHEVQEFGHDLPGTLVSLYFKISVNYRKDSTGKYAGFTMVARDITEEKIADKKIIESERKYRSVVESIREVVFQTDIWGKWTFLNPAWKEMSGHDIYVSLEQPIVNFLHRDDQLIIKQLFQHIIQGKKDEAKCEIRFIDNRNEVFWAEMFIKVYLDDTGRIAGTSGTLNDITKRKKAEETLRRSNQLLESINKNITEALIRVTFKEGLLYFNQAFIDMFGYHTSSEIQELPLHALFARQDDLRTYIKVLQEEKTFTNKTILFKRKDGTTFWGLSSFILIHDENGNAFYDGAIRDITDRKEAEKKLKEKNQELIKTNEELDRFVYSASHDLRAPLASTLGLINISRLSDDEKERTYYLDLMEQSLNRMDKIIQDLTDYSRNARLEIETEEIHFEHMIKDIFQRLKYLKNIDDVHVKTQIEAEGKFYSDKIRLYIILINVISNAIKYHKCDQPYPFISINITINAEKAVIVVSDNGIGIDKNYFEKIFTMFFQVSRDSVGSGLGLYIAKETVNKLQGSIIVESTVSKGSIFTVTLPNAMGYSYSVEAK